MGSQKICRTCAKKENPNSLLTFLFGEEADQLDLRSKIEKYTPIKLNDDDCFPKSICDDCKKVIILWHFFWEKCLKIDTDLRSKQVNPVEVKGPWRDCEKLSLPPETGEKNEKIHQTAPKDKIANNKKGRYCIAKWCNNDNTKRRMFRVPKDKRNCVWLARAGRDDMKDLDIKKLHYKYLCEDHFTDDMFVDTVKKNKLVWNALPTIFPKRKGIVHSPSLAKDKAENQINEIHRKRFRPIMIKEPKLSKSSAHSQPSFTGSDNSDRNLLGLSKLNKNINTTQLVLTNANHENINSQNSRSDKITNNFEKSTNSLLKANKVVHTGHSLKLSIELNTSEMQFCHVNSRVDMIKENSCNKTVSSGVNMLAVSDNVQENSERESSVKVPENMSIDNSSQEGRITSITNAKPNTDVVISNKEGLSYSTELTFESLNSVGDQDVTSLSKNVNSCTSVMTDSIDTFKESDVDSLCSSRCFIECMYPCYACGEVFLAQSSLAQHCKTYHEKFDENITDPL